MNSKARQFLTPGGRACFAVAAGSIFSLSASFYSPQNTQRTRRGKIRTTPHPTARTRRSCEFGRLYEDDEWTTN